MHTIFSCTNAGAIPLTGSEVVDGTGLILLDGLRCVGNELRLIECPHNGFLKHDCSGHSGDAGVKCLPNSSESESSNSVSIITWFHRAPCLSLIHLHIYADPIYNLLNWLECGFRKCHSGGHYRRLHCWS